jgi:hypothetical protein
MLKEGHKHLSGLDEAVIKNIDACKQLSKITRTSLGPNGAHLAAPAARCVQRVRSKAAHAQRKVARVRRWLRCTRGGAARRRLAGCQP